MINYALTKTAYVKKKKSLSLWDLEIILEVRMEGAGKEFLMVSTKEDKIWVIFFSTFLTTEDYIFSFLIFA